MDFDPDTMTVSGSGPTGTWQRFTVENGVTRVHWSHDGEHWHPLGDGEQVPDPAYMPNRAARRAARFKGAA